MPDLDLTDAYEAAAQALFKDNRLWFHFTDAHFELGGVADARRASAQVAVDAAAPVIAAQLATPRRRIARLVSSGLMFAVVMGLAVAGALTLLALIFTEWL